MVIDQVPPMSAQAFQVRSNGDLIHTNFPAANVGYVYKRQQSMT